MALTMHRHIVRESERHRGGGGQRGKERKGTQRIEPSGRGVRRARARQTERERGRKPLLIFISSARSSQLLVVAVRRCVVIGYVSF